jgi:hypothetical protein
MYAKNVPTFALLQNVDKRSVSSKPKGISKRHRHFFMTLFCRMLD